MSFTPNNPSSQSSGLPNAYMRYVLYDETGTRAIRSGRVFVTSAANAGWEKLEFEYEVPENGLLQIYTANETDAQNVWFDDLKVDFTPQLIVQENHYYPFGLELAGLNKLNQPEHRWKFQGQEEQKEFGLNWSSFKWRNADVALGRFFSVDPLAEKYVHNSTYAFSENKVTADFELEGLESRPARAGRRATRGGARQSRRTYSEYNPTSGLSHGTVQKIYRQLPWLARGRHRASVNRSRGMSAAVIGLALNNVANSNKLYYENPEDYPEWYINEVSDRVAKGEADANDYKLLDEVNKRKGRLIKTLGPVITPLRGKPRITVHSEDGIIEFYHDIQVKSGEIKEVDAISDFKMTDGILKLEGFHIGGLEPGDVGAKGLSEIMQQIGRVFGAKEIHLQGGTRTTGKYKGKKPKPRIIKINYD